MEQEHRFDKDGVTYIMRPADSQSAWEAIKKAGALLRGIQLKAPPKDDEAKDENLDASGAIGAILSNLGDPAVSNIETLVFDHTNVVPENGEPFKLSRQLNQHFNQHRAHMLPVLIEGVKYQFSDFFSGGLQSLAGLIPGVKSKAQ